MPPLGLSWNWLHYFTMYTFLGIPHIHSSWYLYNCILFCCTTTPSFLDFTFNKNCRIFLHIYLNHLQSVAWHTCILRDVGHYKHVLRKVAKFRNVREAFFPSLHVRERICSFVLCYKPCQSEWLAWPYDHLAQVGDFGLVRLGSGGTHTATLIKTTTVFGTSAYMAPEAFRGDISVKMDTFSFGIVRQRKKIFYVVDYIKRFRDSSSTQIYLKLQQVSNKPHILYEFNSSWNL